MNVTRDEGIGGKMKKLIIIAICLGIVACSQSPVAPMLDKPEILYFKATPDRITSGEATMLIWKAIGFTRIVMDADGFKMTEVTDFPLNEHGEQGAWVAPKKPTMFLLTAVGPGGVFTERVWVQVI